MDFNDTEIKLGLLLANRII